MYNIFITHAFKEDEDYKQLLKWIEESGLADRINVVSDPDKDKLPEGTNLRQELTNQIAKADEVIVLGNMYAYAAGWLDHEFLETKNLGKRLVLVKPLARAFAKNATVPFPVQGSANVVLLMHDQTIINYLKQTVSIYE